jgi:polyphosphate glucokinase
MKSRPKKRLRVLTIDVGGTSVKCQMSGRQKPVRFKSGPDLTPERMVSNVLAVTAGWRFDAISIGYPGVVHRGAITAEPHNLGSGWVGFDFQSAFGCPVRVINDAAMQALGAYTGGSMLFLGLGTGLGSALVVDGVVAPLELGHFPARHGGSYESLVGERARKRHGDRKWRRDVEQVLEDLRQAMLPDYVVLGGGNVLRLKRLPPHTRRGANANAFTGGFRLWQHETTAAASIRPSIRSQT